RGPGGGHTRPRRGHHTGPAAAQATGRGREGVQCLPSGSPAQWV
ncbi:LOW QUALITY PROTEIN: hypothetical protein SSOG_08031, partial [Streptomyces himastatinicus ATCC 53653]